MKRKLTIAMCMVLAAGSACFVIGAAGTGDEPGEARQVAIGGRLSCTFCALANPDRLCPPGCCAECVNAGDPPLLTDAEGNMYLLLASEKEMTLMTPARMILMGSQVNVTGLLVKRNGIQAIYVETLEAAQAMKVSITGKLSCAFCLLADPSRSCPPGCCLDCVKAGDPPLLTDAAGNIYLLLTGEQGMTLMTPERVEMLGEQATVEGLLVSRNGVRALYVDSMQPVTSITQP